MEGKALPAPGSPATQEAAAVRVLITYVYRLHGLPVPKSEADLPEFYRLDPSLCLVRDGKKRDVYNVTTPTSCSCQTGHKPGEPCRHTRIFFPSRKINENKL
jgi:hypothetical protein